MQKILKPKYILFATFISLSLTIISISCKLQIKEYIPENLTQYNIQILPKLFLLGTSILIALFWTTVKIKDSQKILAILISWVLIFFVSISVGHAFVNKATQNYYINNKETFSELFQLINENNICEITNLITDKSIIIKDCENNIIQNNIVSKKSKNIGFRELSRTNNNITILYEASMWGGYGFYFDKNENEGPKNLSFENTKKWLEVDENVYYFAL